jgi:hypothetical protein
MVVFGVVMPVNMAASTTNITMVMVCGVCLDIYKNPSGN